MKIALVAAEFEENLAIRYLWSAAKAHGHEVVFVPFNEMAELEQAATAIARSGADLAAYSMVFTARARQFCRLAEQARRLGFKGCALAGGHFATFHAVELLRDCSALDAVGCGEGETLLVQLAEHLADPSLVPGLVWRDAQGAVRSNGQPMPQDDLDVIQAPEHRRPFDTFLGIPAANIVGSRGCLHACAFCSISAWHRHCGGRRLRLRSPAAVADEMLSLFREGVRIFNFHDDNFFLPERAESRERFRALASEWRTRGIRDIAFAVKARPDEIDEELIDRLHEMGLFRVFLGIEGGSQATLAQLGRGQHLVDNERALAILGKRRLHTCFNLLLLNPDSTLDDLRDNAAFLARHRDHPMNFCRTEVYAGTPLEARLRRQGRLLGDMWGLDYVIGDPRAEQAYEALRYVLAGRSASMSSVNYLAMLVDFELQLLERFHGRQDVLRRQARELIRRLNGDTAQRLEAIVDMAEKDRLSGAEGMSSLERLLDETVAADQGFASEAAELTRGIRSAASRRQPTRFRLSLPAAAAALLATSALFGQTAETSAPKSPEALRQESELESLRSEIGQQLAESDLVERFMLTDRPLFVLRVDLDGNGRIRLAQALAKAQMSLESGVDAELTGLLPQLNVKTRPNLASHTLLIAFQRDEFVPGECSRVTIHVDQSMICEFVAASPRDGVAIKKPKKGR